MLLLTYKIISKLIPYTHYFMKPTEANSYKKPSGEMAAPYFCHGEDVNKIF